MHEQIDNCQNGPNFSNLDMFGEAERLPFLDNKDILHENLTNINEHIHTGNNNTLWNLTTARMLVIKELSPDSAAEHSKILFVVSFNPFKLT